MIPTVKNVQVNSVFLSRPQPNSIYGPGYTLSAPAPSPASYVGATALTGGWEDVSPPEEPVQKWSEIRKSGRIKMTAYYHKKVELNRFDIYLPRMSAAANVCRNDDQTNQSQGIATQSWEQLLIWNSSGVGAGQPINVGTLFTEAARCRSRVAAALFDKVQSSYDPMTELAEFKQLVSFVRGLLEKLTDILGIIKRKEYLSWSLADLWLAFRYALMPIVYSIGDIQRLVDQIGRRQEFFVFRTGETISSSRPASIPEGLSCYQEGTIEIRGVCRRRLSLRGELRGLQILLDRCSFNPIKTGWELVPFSFVIDWFLNLGSWLTSLMWVDWSSESKATISERRRYIEFTVYRDKAGVQAYWPSSSLVAPGQLAYSWSTDQEYLLQRQKFDEYDRSIHQLQDFNPGVDVYLNWKRFIDSIALIVVRLQRAHGSMR